MKVHPLSDRILIKRIEVEEQVKGGIIIPDTAKEKPMEAEVIAVGPGKPNDGGDRVPPEVNIGDRVLVAEYGGTEVEIDGDAYVIVNEDDILGILG